MKLGLRAQSALALLLCIAIVIGLAVVPGLQASRAIEDNLGAAFVRNATQYNKQRILTPVLRELALSKQLAVSEVTRRWLLDENNPEKKAYFFTEAERYRQNFDDHSYFIVFASSRNYYYNDQRSPHNERPINTLRANRPTDSWFFNTLAKVDDFDLNVDVDPAVHATKVWFNVVVKDRGKKIGIVGSGLDFTKFTNRFIAHSEPGTTPIIVALNGAIQAYPDRSKIDYSPVSESGPAHSTIFNLVRDGDERAAVRAALLQARTDPNSIPEFWASLNGHRDLFAVSYLPDLKWYVLTAADLRAAGVIDSKLWLPLLVLGVGLLALLVLAIMLAVDRLLLRPLLKLTESARAVTAGDYAIELPPAGNDELGELTRAFGVMATQVASHTDLLEQRVSERTHELVALNEQMSAANKKISDSIQYASLLQNAILPDREMQRALGDSYFVLWRPRDVVGGDFYVFRDDPRGYLIGVIDCAGHGVPGAFMTMIAHAVINVALEHLGPRDPAALLNRMDASIRATLQADPGYAKLATHMDAGFAFVDLEARDIVFAGAKISLYWSDGQSLGELSGSRNAVAGKRATTYVNASTPFDPGATFYLTTDGLIDQAGGLKGYSFGQSRFANLLLRHAGRPFAEQRAALAQELAEYQGTHLQRDDITVVSFRFTHPEEPYAT